MNKNIIGLKLADGTFYPILKRGKPVKKKLQVTTASDNQTTVQINLFCASDESFSDAEYVDTLMIDGLVSQESRGPAIDLLLTLDENDVLTADLFDQESGEASKSSVSLVTLENDELDDYLTNFEVTSDPFIEDDSLDFSGADFDESDFNDAPNFTDPSLINNFEYVDSGKKKNSIVSLICILCAFVSVLSLLGIFYVVIQNKEKEAELALQPLPSVKYETVTVVSEQGDYPQQLQAAVAREDTIVVVDAPVVIPAPVASTSVITEPKLYQVKWGDTLWDLADTFYKNPWMYDKIASANNIKNPDFILSGTWISIPPK